MEYIDLNRDFAQIKKDEEANHLLARHWGKKYAGYLNWDKVLEKKRVVLLAEASSGKTEEFRNTTGKLRKQGKTAFFIAIEELADEGFEGALSPDETQQFEKWKTDFDTGYFFLDSLDEARLNRKRFDRALKKLAKSIGTTNLERSHIFVSCRISDWLGKDDRQAFMEILPIPETKHPQCPTDPDQALLDPIFENKHQKTSYESDDGNTENNKATNKNELFVIQLSPLDESQQKLLAKHYRVDDVDVFYQAIWQNGLENLAERPGDLIELAEYWKSHKRFGSLKDMTRHGIIQKISEHDPHRSDNNILTEEKALAGIERIAAALTLGKTFTLKIPSKDHDPELAQGALDPKKILPDWNEAEITALLRRAVFTPATYGRIRFHHRSSQEYLSAQWLDKLISKGCPDSAIFKLLFVDQYDARIVAPSLRPTASWLATSRPNIANEILKRDPLILIQYGDPGSLPISTRQRLLHAYAEKHEAGDITNDSLDHRALWMFAHPELAQTINDVWDKCTQYDFHGDMLRLIREGKITGCTDLLSKYANNDNSNQYYRTIAVEILADQDENKIIKKIVDKLLNKKLPQNHRSISGIASALYPKYLSTEQPLKIIKDTPPPNKNSVGGFGYDLKHLYQQCPEKQRLGFIGGIAELALSEPFADKYRKISLHYEYLIKYSSAILAKQIITELGDNNPPDDLVRFLLAIERVNHTYDHHDEDPSLNELVRNKPKIQQKLFWAEVNEIKKHRKENKAPLVHFWEIRAHYITPVWQLRDADLEWLYRDINLSHPDDDKRLLLSTILSTLNDISKLDEHVDKLRTITKSSITLSDDLESFLAPPQESEAMRNHEENQKKREAQRKQEEDTNKESWRVFRNEVIADPTVISTSREVIEGPSFDTLFTLTRWLSRRTNKYRDESPRHWHLLTEGFNEEVALAYKSGMKALWHYTKPERPRRGKGGTVTTKYINIFAFAGIGIEADENPRWAANLSKEEALLAAKHGCYSEQGYPDWFNSLIDAHTDIVLPIIREEIKREWTTSNGGHSNFFNNFRYQANQTIPAVSSILFDVFMRSDVTALNRLEDAVVMIQSMNLTNTQLRRLARISTQRFDKHNSDGNLDFALYYLALLFKANADDAIVRLGKWLTDTPARHRKELAISIFGVIFNRENRNLLGNCLSNVSTDHLSSLVRLAYRYVKPNEDRDIESGIVHRDQRRNAEDGRNTVLSALINKTGIDAYLAMRKLTTAPETRNRAHRFSQLARQIAERDSDISEWKEDETLKFEAEYISPIKSGNDLYRLVLDTLDNIRHDLDNQDASSKRLLSRLKDIENDDEDSVQGWIAEQLRLRANGRFHVHRESEVANKKEPDIIISSTACNAEVAIEVKQADSWSINELLHALTHQLAENYLKPENRRHGVLFVTNHGRKRWKDPDTNKFVTFMQPLTQLKKTAKIITKNSCGSISVDVAEIDTTK